MKPINITLNQYDMFKMELDKIVNKKDSLIMLANLINWDFFHNEFSEAFKGKTGKPPKSIRLVTGLLMLKYVYNYSDYQVIFNLERNVYFQYFCGYFTIQNTELISRSSLVKFRSKIGETGAELIFKHIIELSKKLGILKKGEGKVITDTTAVEKNIKYPTDIELLEKTRKNLVKEGKKYGLIKRDKYSKEGPKIRSEALRHAKGNKKDLLEEKKSYQKKMLKETLDRIINIKKKPSKIESKTEPKIETIPIPFEINPESTEKSSSVNKHEDIQNNLKDNEHISKALTNQIDNSIRLLYQQKGSKNKLYSNYEPQTYCIAKGKANKKYEYGHKLSIVIDHSSGILLSSKAILANKYDGDILDESITKAEEITETNIKEIYADKGYRKKTKGKQGTEGTIKKDQILYISGTKSKNKRIKKDKKRRSLVESRISELKRMCRGSINYLKGTIGDKINASLVGLAENIRIIMRHLSVKLN